mmetsp:Transcript_5607/g.11724  ORF Transcript_5607/g.11724 Transcript_5607/m.11724 type:complete len:115 (-) Transcript_5607:505-849(-)|eukprot:CAMPEP_0116938350 /NCGR_PEP_ID=MMETSP0467-20121206/32068_1 /TAXON_ID=283647 /ORGANISM="Mesodinium pulex, Strain SPMC105" /LENGTH=114 /DNA_ID=CAMNT_0004620381 /DNA_START=455 /DNA_END=799 /DNA_ORIENTATION=+
MKAIAHMMREPGTNFPFDIPVQDIIKLHYQTHSVQIDIQKAALMAATLASGGVNPLSGNRVFDTKLVRNALSIMSSCGMQDISGEYMFKVGVPSINSQSGLIQLVVPNVMGVAI